MMEKALRTICIKKACDIKNAEQLCNRKKKSNGKSGITNPLLMRRVIAWLLGRKLEMSRRLWAQNNSSQKISFSKCLLV